MQNNVFGENWGGGGRGKGGGGGKNGGDDGLISFN